LLSVGSGERRNLKLVSSLEEISDFAAGLRCKENEMLEKCKS
jgi:hypothetical protein